MARAHPPWTRLRLATTVLAISALAAASLTALPAGASSHREAPLIMGDPLADNTDVYAFVSPDKPDTVTLVANYVPFQQPAGGPNFYRFGDDVLYEIHVDNRGDARSHVTFKFQFQTRTVDPNTFLYNTGPITWDPTSHTYVNWNRPQTYQIRVNPAIDDDGDNDRDDRILGDNLLTPPADVGPASTPNYHDLASHAIYDLGNGIKVFAGQRDDPFFADLARIFDLLHVTAPGRDYVAGLNVNSIVLQVPKSLLQGPSPNDPVIGVWATASRRQTRVLQDDGRTNGSGRWVQVSRLGNPLVNEVIIPLGEKDHFNATKLLRDSDAPFAPFVLSPEPARLLRALNIDPGAPTDNRQDLATVFLTGVPGINKPAGDVRPSEQLRLNMSIAPSSADPNAVNRLGVLGGQLDGFPNGRRLADDVVDIELTAVAGILCQSGGPLAGTSPCRTTPAPTLGDGVNANDVLFQTSFPYLADPHPPYS